MVKQNSKQKMFIEFLNWSSLEKCKAKIKILKIVYVLYSIIWFFFNVYAIIETEK